MAVKVKICRFCRSAVPLAATVCPRCTREIDTQDNVDMLVDRELSRRHWRNLFIVIAIIVVLGLLQHWSN